MRSVGIPGLEDFCFPDGVHNESLEDSEETNELITLMHSQDHLKHPENLFVFLFTDQESQVYYGICVHKKELLGVCHVGCDDLGVFGEWLTGRV